MERHTQVKFRAHHPAHKKMICIGRGARVSISVGTECREGIVPEHPRIVRRVRESRRFLAITETSWSVRGPSVLDTGEEEGEMRQGSSVLTITTSFLFANSVSGQLRKLRFFSGVKNDMKTEAEDQWDTESTSSTSTSSSLSSPEKGQRQEPTLRLRGGCLKLPARQGSKRRLGDDEELPTLVWWAAGGRTHHKPLTGKQLREWKRKSDGYERGNKKRSWIGEFAFAMTSGRVGRESGNKKEKKKKGEDPENGGDEGDDGGGDGEGGS